MPKCQKCGNEYKIFLGGAAGFCEPCFRQRIEEQEAKQKKVEPDTKADLPALVHALVGEEKLKAFGVAYWNNTGSVIQSIFDQIMGRLLFGGLGGGLTSNTHRMGVIAVSESTLYVVDLGALVGEVIKIKQRNLVNFGKHAKTASLKNVAMTLQDSNADQILCIKGDISVKATFPNSFESGNANKATAIIRAVMTSDTPGRRCQKCGAILLANEQPCSQCWAREQVKLITPFAAWFVSFKGVLVLVSICLIFSLCFALSTKAGGSGFFFLLCAVFSGLGAAALFLKALRTRFPFLNKEIGGTTTKSSGREDARKVGQ